MRTLVWLRRDLRLRDNAALYHAAGNGEVILVFVLCPGQWKQHDDAAVKVDFWLRNLAALSDSCSERRFPLRIVRTTTYQQVPERLVNLARRLHCDALYYNKEYEVNERKRDEAVTHACTRAGLQVRSFADRVIIPPGEILTKAEKFYSVFTPFKRTWLAHLGDRGALRPLPLPRRQASLNIPASHIPSQISGFSAVADVKQWPAGEGAALRRLRRFARTALRSYDSQRDRPAQNGTSRLSPYLAAGVVSPRQCLHAALRASGGRLDRPAAPATWINELIWRDFYQHILVGYPRVSTHQPFRLDTRRVRWNHDDEHFTAWCHGRTGYPFVDAGMRELLATGWMHNRLRMVTTMFLSKHLLLDWRRGERFFMQHLIDGDLGSNNGGWQWSASTGTDAAPYFRVFNPTTQSERYDPDGTYIRRWVEELAGIDSKHIHDPPAKMRSQVSYPAPIVDHATARRRAIDAFAKL